MLDSLTQRQTRFVFNYFKGMSLTRAAMESGYSQHAPSAAVQGHRLLRNAKVVLAVQYLNEEAKISPDSVISKLASVFNAKKTKASDIIKLSKLFFKIEGLDLTKSDTRKPTRSKKKATDLIYAPYIFKEVNGDTYNKEVIEEAKPQRIQQAIPKSIPEAVPTHILKATPKPGEMRTPTPAYSLFGFKGDDESDSASQSGSKVFYPA